MGWVLGGNGEPDLYFRPDPASPRDVPGAVLGFPRAFGDLLRSLIFRKDGGVIPGVGNQVADLQAALSAGFCDRCAELLARNPGALHPGHRDKCRACRR
ncbi:hypothetical protein Gbro_1424 [Gordonia bronchialis DSM 43247]|uniref:Uncharacterized protein n=1 Tax=Gordonia bronchialis (strain ATCC 25592 / DSM 43247 / BCRC 13721 / JCM 3198 / KCTC 3076 / NBRC 16047 / NCTC 10667) TaxID=526226 RepID=D0L6E9_GORB4|nr:hypothetical protein Gbro_1424 [Gordonia bronchialis DSM 43247]STQ63535.1 Uncharacterised protein [Gordonia bronchialis]